MLTKYVIQLLAYSKHRLHLANVVIVVAVSITFDICQKFKKELGDPLL